MKTVVCCECDDRTPICWICEKPIEAHETCACATDKEAHMHLNGECGWITADLVEDEDND